MSRIVSRPFRRTQRKTIHAGDSVITLLGRALLMLAAWTSPTTSAPAQTTNFLTVSPNPACLGQAITVIVPVSCAENPNPLAKEDGTSVTLTNNWNGTWSGFFTATKAGTVQVTASDNCGDVFTNSPVTLTVVKLTDITPAAGPAGSGWTHLYADTNRDYAALLSSTPGDVVTFGLNMTPNTATAATLVSWSGATPSANNLTATYPATSVSGPSAVTASGCNFTTPPYTVWIFWGYIGYNFNGPLAALDKLTFPSAFSTNTTNAGPMVATISPLLVAMNQIEIIGTLRPSGIGNLVGNVFTFDPQVYAGYIWSSDGTANGTNLTTVSTNTPGTYHSGNDPYQFGTKYQQPQPASDMIFAIDECGVGERVGAVGFEGNAANFTNYIYMNNGAKASSPGYWYSHVRATYLTNTLTASPCTAGSGNPPLPTTWGSSNW